MVSSQPMKKNTGITIVFPIFDADGDPVTGAASDSPDSEYSLDGGSFSDCTNEISEIATNSGIYSLVLEAAETNGDVVCIQVKTATAGTKTTVLVFYTAARTLDETSSVTLTGTASAGSTTTITLTGGVATDNYYNGQIVKILSGTGAGQTRTILSYVGSSAIATVTRDWATAPSTDSVFSVHAGDYPGILEAGTAQAGAAASITLDANASPINDTYKNNSIMITGGTGIGQCRLISGYTGSSKVATILPNWTTNPDSSSVYQVLPMARVDVAGVSGIVQTANDNGADINLILQLLQNKLVVDVDNGNLVLYNNAGDTPLLTWPLLDKDGNAISVATGVPTQRGVPS